METRDIKGVRARGSSVQGHSWVRYEMRIGRLGNSPMILMSEELEGSQILHIKDEVSG